MPVVEVLVPLKNSPKQLAKQLNLLMLRGRLSHFFVFVCIWGRD